jgi:hypothetical protein
MEDKNLIDNTKNLYFLIVDGKKSDPLTFHQLKERSVGEDDLVWRKGLEIWVKARDLEELSEIVIFNPPPIPDTQIKHTLPKINHFSVRKKNRILVVLVLLTMFFIFISFKVLNKSKNVHDQKNNASEIIDTISKNNLIEEISSNNESESFTSLSIENKVENKSKISLPKNYYLSKNLKNVYVFDDVNKYWWWKHLIDDPSEVVPILTKDEIDFVMNSDLKIEINGWHIQTIDFAVDKLNTQYKKEGKVYQPKGLISTQ